MVSAFVWCLAHINRVRILLGTIVSISQDTQKMFGNAIGARLRVRDTVLRASGDASLLLESLLDLGKHINTRLGSSFQKSVV